MRAPGQYSTEHIPGAINVPVPKIAAYGKRIEDAPKTVLYCNDTRFTRVAEQILRRKSIKGFFHLRGGLNAWREAGLPLESSLPD